MPFAPAVGLESRVAVLDGLERADTIASRIWVTQADRLADLIALTPASLHKGLPAEVGAHLTVPEGTARTLLDTAWELRARPRVREAVLTGRLNPRQVDVVLDELACVEPAAAEVILDELLGRSPTAGGRVVLRPAQLRRWVHRRAVAADPDGAKKRRVMAEREETGVRYRSLPNGLAQKITTGPAVEIQKAMRQLDALTPPRDPDDDRTRGQLLLATETGAIAFAAAAHGVGPVPV